MRRREEVEQVIAESYRSSYLPPLEDFARTLADKVDARDAVITKLLEMMEPGVAPPKSHKSCSCFDCRQYEINEGRYNRALEIAGRNG